MQFIISKNMHDCRKDPNQYVIEHTWNYFEDNKIFKFLLF